MHRTGPAVQFASAERNSVPAPPVIGPTLCASMKHDFATSIDKTTEDRFRAWLEAETTDGLKREYGDGEGTKSMIFLFVNRAFEAHMPEPLIGETFGKCIVRAGYRENEEERAFDLLEFLAGIARGVHGGT